MSIAENIQFELVSPERRLISEPVYHVVIPGEMGEMGIGPGHSAYVVALKPGYVRLYKEKGGALSQRIFVAGGFADVTGEHCTVLAEQAVNASEINLADVEKEIRDLKADLVLAVEATDKARIEKKIVLAEAKLAGL